MNPWKGCPHKVSEWATRSVYQKKNNAQAIHNLRRTSDRSKENYNWSETS